MCIWFFKTDKETRKLLNSRYYGNVKAYVLLTANTYQLTLTNGDTITTSVPKGWNVLIAT